MPIRRLGAGKSRRLSSSRLAQGVQLARSFFDASRGRRKTPDREPPERAAPVMRSPGLNPGLGEIPMEPVESSNLAQIGYDDDSQTLRIEFHSGSVYDYYDVPYPIFWGLRRADSKGKFHHRYIRLSFRYLRIQ